MCVSVYDLDDDRVGRRRPSAGSIVHTDYIIIVIEDEQCRKGGDTLERVLGAGIAQWLERRTRD